MPTSYSEIDSVAEQMKAAGAPDSDVAQYVQLAMQEVSGRGTAEPAANQPAAYTLKNLVAGLKTFASDERGLRSVPRRAAANAKEVATDPTMLRVGLPVAATIASAGLGAPALLTALAGGTAAAGGEALAQLSESGEVTDKGQIAKSGAFGAAPVTRFLPGAGALRTAARIGGEGAKFAALEAVGETGRKSINAGEVTAPYENIEQAARSMALPAAIGSAFGGVGEIVRKVGNAGAVRAERLGALSAAGIERPTLDLIFPTQAALVNRVASLTPAVAKLRVDAERPLLQQFEALAEGAPGHEAIYSRLRPYVGRLDAMRDELGALEQRAATLREQATAAQQAAQITPEMRQAVMGEATAAELNAVNARAKLLHQTSADLGGFVDYDSAAQEFGEVVDRLFKTRKTIGAARFDAAGVPSNAAIFAKADLLGAARDSLQRWRGTDLEKRILGAIEDAGGAEAEALTLSQFRELRGAFTDRFAGMDPRQLASAEAAGRNAYGALTEASKKTIAAFPGADLDAYNAAVGYWRDTAEAASSRYARPLLTQEPSESTFQTLANDLASGRKAEVRAFNEFVQAVAQDAPDVARLASQRLTRAVRNSFLGNARTATGIDPRKLTDSLLKAEGQFEIGALGFGTATDVRRWAATLKEFNVKNLAEADLDGMFADPQVQRALAEGKPLGDALRPSVAKAAFQQRVNERALQMAIGNHSAAAKASTEALKAAESAGLTVAERRAALAALEADPIMGAFAGRQTWGIPARPGAGGGGNNEITKTMLNLGPDDGLKLVRALRKKNPDLAEQLQRRVLADVVQDFFRPANTPGHVYALNKAEVQRFFHPPAGSNEATQLATIQGLVGNERFANMEKLLNAVRMVHDVERAGGIMSTDGAKTIFTSSALARGIGMGAAGSNQPGLIMSGVRSIGDLWARGRYNILANLASPGPFRDAFWQSGGALEPALDSMAAQRFFLLARDPALKREVDQELGGR